MADKPSAKFRIGAVTATVWENKNGDRSFYSTTLVRSYKDGEDWKEADSFNHGDLLNAAEVMRRAESWIAAQ
jgi:hypothetical protein